MRRFKPGQRVEDMEGDQATIVSDDPLTLIWDCRQDGEPCQPHPSYRQMLTPVYDDD